MNLNRILARLRKPLKAVRNRDGLTLIELVIVISLIALIATFAASNFFRTAAKAKVDATKVQMKQLGNVLDLYRQECGTYPTTEQGLDALLNEPAAEPKCRNYDREGYLKEKKLPGDGFGNPFLYESDGSKYVLISLGADRKEGGEDENRDLRSDQPE